MKILLPLIFFVVLSGCVSSNVKNVKGLTGNEEICIVENKAVRHDFLKAYQRQINQKGYKTQIIEPTESSTCVYTTTYSATYGFHWGMYLATAKLKVFNGADLVGKATYQAPFASPAKHGRVEGKINILVDELLN